MTVRSSGRTGLSKSLILKGMQCQRALWLARNPPWFSRKPRKRGPSYCAPVAEALHARVRVIFEPVESGAGAQVAETPEA